MFCNSDLAPSQHSWPGPPCRTPPHARLVPTSQLCQGQRGSRLQAPCRARWERWVAGGGWGHAQGSPRQQASRGRDPPGWAARVGQRGCGHREQALGGGWGGCLLPHCSGLEARPRVPRASPAVSPSPSVCFPGVPSGGGQGSWHSQGPLLSRRTVWEASQERLAGIQAWARRACGAHSPTAPPAGQPEGLRRPGLFPGSSGHGPGGVSGQRAAGPGVGRGGDAGSSWVAKSGAGLCPQLAPVTLGKVVSPRAPVSSALEVEGAPCDRMLISLAWGVGGWRCLQVPLLHPWRAWLTPAGTTPRLRAFHAGSAGPPRWWPACVCGL